MSQRRSQKHKKRAARQAKAAQKATNPNELARDLIRRGLAGRGIQNPYQTYQVPQSEQETTR